MVPRANKLCSWATPYTWKAETVGGEQNLREAFGQQLGEFNRRFAPQQGLYGHFFGLSVSQGHA
ncbi:MAG: hypothetical protein ABSG32_06875 [Terriglobia bacterium]